MNKHRADTDDQATPTRRPPADTSDPLPPNALPLSAWVFAGGFAVAAVWHLVYDATHDNYAAAQLTIFLSSAALLILGYPIGKLVGRK